MKLNFDKLGILTSLLCAVHCVALPLLVSTLPLLGIELIENKMLEWGMIALSLLAGLLSLWPAYRHQHHRAGPSVVFVAGFTCLLLNQLAGEAWVWLLIPVAAVLIISAHIYNIYLRRTGRF